MVLNCSISERDVKPINASVSLEPQLNVSLGVK